MTLDELEAKLDEVMETGDADLRATKLVDLKLAMRDYKAERDEVELNKDAEIEALKGEIEEHKKSIDELKESNSALAQRYGKIAMRDEEEANDKEEQADDLDELIKKFA